MTEPRFKLFSVQPEILSESKEASSNGARHVRVIASTPAVDRMGDVVVQEGIDLLAYKRNPVVLWQHNSDMPVAKAVEIGIEGGKLKALVEFPAEGVDADADGAIFPVTATWRDRADAGDQPGTGDVGKLAGRVADDDNERVRRRQSGVADRVDPFPGIAGAELVVRRGREQFAHCR